MAKKGQFDLYTITNLSVMDIAEYLTMRPNLFSVSKNDLGNYSEVVGEFSNSSHFNVKSHFELLPDEPSIHRQQIYL